MNLSSESLPAHQKRTGRDHFRFLFHNKLNLGLVSSMVPIIAYIIGYNSIHRLLEGLGVSPDDLNIVPWDYLKYSFLILYSLVSNSLFPLILFYSILIFIPNCISYLFPKVKPPITLEEKKERYEQRYIDCRYAAGQGNALKKLESILRHFQVVFFKNYNFFVIPSSLIFNLIFYNFSDTMGLGLKIQFFILSFAWMFFSFYISKYKHHFIVFFSFTLFTIFMIVYLLTSPYFFVDQELKKNKCEGTSVTISNNSVIKTPNILSFDQF